MMKKALALIAGLAIAMTAHADVSTQWNFESVTVPTGTPTTWANIAASTGTGVASIVHAGASSFTAPAGNGSSKSIAANTWAIGDYFQFTFSTTGATGLSISFDQTGSNTGPRDFKVSYSTDGTTFTDVTNGSYALINNSWSATSAKTGSSYSFDLSDVSSLNNQATVYIRLVDTSTTAISGTFGAGGTSRVDNFTVSVSAVPEPGTTAMFIAGLAAVGFVARRRRPQGA